MAKKKRTIVGSPLTPQMLFQLGATSGFSPDEKPFNPAGEWTNRYTIWTCHGYRESGNMDVGFLQIQRGPTGSDKRFELQVHQEIRNEEGSLNRIVARIDCMEGDISYPVKWHYTSVFLNADEPIADCNGPDPRGARTHKRIKYHAVFRRRHQPAQILH